MDREQYIQRWRLGSKKVSRYQVGPLFFYNKTNVGNYFVMKIFRPYINKDIYNDFYRFHLNHYIKRNPLGTEKEFFEVIWEIVKEGIENQRKLPYSTTAIKRKDKLAEFQQYLQSIDHWQNTKPIEDVLKEKNEKIEELEAEIKKLKSELKRLNTVDGAKIDISNGSKESVISLFLQMQRLEYTKGKELLITKAQTTWAKILSNHFLEKGKPIKYGTALNYFQVEDKDQRKVPTKRKTEVDEKDYPYIIVTKDS